MGSLRPYWSCRNGNFKWFNLTYVPADERRLSYDSLPCLSRMVFLPMEPLKMKLKKFEKHSSFFFI